MQHRSSQYILVLLLLLLLLVPLPARAQQELRLSLNKNFGYNDFSGRMQGTFTLGAEGPTDLTQVTFYLDDQVLRVDREPPFETRFNTADFAPGRHTLSAVGLTSQGREVRSAPRAVEFITREQAWRNLRALLLPFLGILAILMSLGVLITALSTRRGGRRPGDYGLAGGAVCPRCGLPFNRHFFALNMILGKLERCPHCGRWSVVRRASPDELEQAQARLKAESSSGAYEVLEEPEQLRRRIEESRFEED